MAGSTALHVAAEYGHRHVAHVLLEVLLLDCFFGVVSLSFPVDSMQGLHVTFKLERVQFKTSAANVRVLLFLTYEKH